MVAQRIRRLILSLLDLFLAATAIAGGLALIVGWIQLPLDWLVGTPFRSFTIPGLVLMVVVGGSALVALVATVTRHPLAAAGSALTGLMIMGFELVEVLVVGSQAGLMRTLQIFYFLFGLVLAVLATWQWAHEHASEPRLHAPVEAHGGR
jgi:hypothetical protein